MEQNEEMHLLYSKDSMTKNFLKTAGHGKYACSQKGKLFFLSPSNSHFSSNRLIFLIFFWEGGASRV